MRYAIPLAVLILVGWTASLTLNEAISHQPSTVAFPTRDEDDLAQLETEPGGTPEDVHMAVNEPFDYAWKLFFFLNRQAKPGKAGVADPAKATLRDYDPDTPVVWETWANATGGLFLREGEPNRSEVYRANGEQPVPWDELPRGETQPKTLEPNLTNVVARIQERLLDTTEERVQPLFDPAVRDDFEFEVRLNRSTYDTIRDQGLYSVEGLEEQFQIAQQTGNRDVIQFDLDSKEIKAKWVRIEETDKPRYHWRTNTITHPDGTTTTELWGLSGLHIITRDLPNWFWTDFEHVDQEPQAIAEGRPSVDPTTRGPNAPHGTNGVRNEMVGTKWEHYRLRGAQINFVDKFGKPTQLANTLIEPIESGPSSCITCHAKATVGLIGGIGGSTNPSAPFNARCLPPDFTDGLPDPDAFESNGQLHFIQTDFLWSMAFRARRAGNPNPEPGDR